jgi:O-antigen/teichoic acid export membrane protein
MAIRVSEPADHQPAITERHVARGLGTTLLARFSAVVEVVAQPLYVAMFGLAGYGLYAVLWAAINLAENIFDLGMTSALQRVVPQAHDEAAELSALKAAFVGGVGPCIIVALAASLAAPMLVPLINVATADAHLVAPAIALFAWALPLWAFVEIATSALRAKQLFGAEIRLRIFWEQIIRLVIAAGFWAAGFGLWGLLIGHMVSLAITAGLAVRLLGRHYALSTLIATPMRPMWTLTLGAGLSVLPANIVARLFGDAPPLILNALIPGAGGASAAALFVIIRKISSIVQLVRTAFAYVLAPVASLAAKHDMAQVSALYGFATRLSAVVALPLALTLAGGSAALLGAFGEGTNSIAMLALMAMLVARGLEATIGNAMPILQVVGSYRVQVVASLIAPFAAASLAAFALPGAPHEELLFLLCAVLALGIILGAAMPFFFLAARTQVHLPLQALMLNVPAAIGLGALGAISAWHLAEALDWPAALGLMVLLALALMWTALRLLPRADRTALGSVGRTLRLV